jgi:hypothetical protein
MVANAARTCPVISGMSVNHLNAGGAVYRQHWLKLGHFAFRMRHGERPLLSEVDVQHLPDRHRRTTEGEPVAERQVPARRVGKPDGYFGTSSAGNNPAET